MKTIFNKYFALILLGLGILMNTQITAQEYKARLSVEFNNVIGEKAYLLINAKYKVDKTYLPADNLQLNVYREVLEDSLQFVGNVTTDNTGNVEFIIEDEVLKSVDSVVTFVYLVKIEDDEKFKDAEKAAKFLVSHLSADITDADTLYVIKAYLTDAVGDPISKEKVKILVQRLFAPLPIGSESSYKTDEKGKIVVPVENPLPGIDGILTIEVKLDSRKYGVVKYIFDAPIGTHVEDLSTYDQRTMWSPPGKTPLFLWIFANIINLAIWIVIILSVRNLVKIYKS